MCQRVTKEDVASHLSRATGDIFENCFMKLSAFDSPSAFTSFGSFEAFDVSGFGKFARSEGIPEGRAAELVSKITGMTLENSMMELSRIPLQRFKR